MKKIFTLFAALAMVMSMSAAKLYLTPNSNWNQSNARFAAYFFGNGDKWISMTKVAGETNLYEVEAPAGYPNVIFCRMNPSSSANNWNNDVKWNQTNDLTIPKDGKNHYTVKAGTWDKGGGEWTIWPVPTAKNYVDVTITVTANAAASIKWHSAGDKLANATDYVAMKAGENNTYTYTLAQVDDFSGVKYTIKVGDVVSEEQTTSTNVTADFKTLMKQAFLKGSMNEWSDKGKMTIADDYLTASIVLSLNAGSYEWKMYVGVDWLGGGKTVTRENNTHKLTDGDNCKLTADLDGDYVFTYTYATKTLVVTYPEPEPELEVMDIEMTNLVVQEMEDFVVLTASDDSNTGLNVMLAVNEDGSLAADSYMAMVQGWNEVELPIVEGKITKAYNEELATDVYSGLVVVEFMEGKLGLNLTMYAKPVVATDVVVTDATITVETEDDGVGGTYEIINIAANWNGSVLKIEGVEKAHEGFIQITETFVVDGEEDWYIWMCMNGVITTVDNVLTVTGEFKNNWTGDVYNVTISGKLPVVEPTTITYELNGGVLPAPAVPTQEELWASFKTAAGLTTLGTLVEITEAGAGKPHNAPDNPCACRIICAKLLDANVNAVFALPEWAWLKAYIMTVQSGLPEASNVSWRYAFAAFFLQSEHSAYPASADFTEAGKPEVWGAAYQAANELVLPTEPVDAPYTLPTPVKEGYTFVGWYDNAEGTGEAYTVIPAGWAGTLYAIWKQSPATALDNIAIEGKVVKTIINGQLIIIKNGVQYNAQGAVIK